MLQKEWHGFVPGRKIYILRHFQLTSRNKVALSYLKNSVSESSPIWSPMQVLMWVSNLLHST